MTEGSGSVLPGGAPKEIAFSGSVGQVSPDNQVKIVDLKTLKTLPLNEEVNFELHLCTFDTSVC